MKRTNCKRCKWFSKIESNNAPWGRRRGKIYKSCLDVNTCPKCKSEDLNYTEGNLFDGMYAYEWHCGYCSASGTEWYNLVFVANEVN